MPPADSAGQGGVGRREAYLTAPVKAGLHHCRHPSSFLKGTHAAVGGNIPQGEVWGLSQPTPPSSTPHLRFFFQSSILVLRVPGAELGGKEGMNELVSFLIELLSSLELVPLQAGNK